MKINTKNVLIVNSIIVVLALLSTIPASASDRTVALDKAFNTTQISVLKNTTVKVDGVYDGIKKVTETKIASQQLYSIDSDSLQIQKGSVSYQSINNKNGRYSTSELAKVREMYPKAKFISAAVGNVSLGSDAPTFMTGYVLEIAKVSQLTTSKSKEGHTVYKFKSSKIDPQSGLNQYPGFSEMPIEGSITVDKNNRITLANASTAKATLKVAYKYGKVTVYTPKPAETIKQEDFISLLQAPK